MALVVRLAVATGEAFEALEQVYIALPLRCKAKLKSPLPHGRAVETAN